MSGHLRNSAYCALPSPAQFCVIKVDTCHFFLIFQHYKLKVL